MDQKLTHIDAAGSASMVDVSPKVPQMRTAVASGHIELQPETLTLIAENSLKKGDVISTARLAGIMAAKQTSNLIPLCHPLLTDKIAVDLQVGEGRIEVEALVRCTGRTGVEMEALTAVSVTLLTIYDMCKAVDKEMVMSSVKLLSKTKVDLV